MNKQGENILDVQTKTKNAAIEERLKNLEEKFKFMENEQKEMNKVSINLKINL
jgi:BMFP domain-containing protein YqiC